MKSLTDLRFLLLALAVGLITLSGCNEDPTAGTALNSPFAQKHEDPGYRGDIVEVNKVATFTNDELKDALNLFGADTTVLDLQYDVDYYSIVYRTLDWNNEPVYSSGAIAVPAGFSGPVRLGAYCHGTTTRNTTVPSTQGPDVLNGNKGEYIIGVLYAATGMAIAMPDYLGLGRSQEYPEGKMPLHPYLNAKTEAMSTVDVLRAARQHLPTLGLSEKSGGVFLYGYSQGGHAAAAAYRELQTYHKNEWDVFAAAPLSGPYNLSGKMVEDVVDQKPYSRPATMAYILLSYDMVYGEELWPELTDFMRKDIRDTVYQYYVDRRAFSFLNEIMPTDVPYDMLTEKGQKSFTQNPSHPLRLALAYNNLLDWKPKSPTLLVYCTADDQVDFTNSLDAYDAWTGNGAKDVTVIDADASLNHTECVIPALTEAKQWLNGVEASAE